MGRPCLGRGRPTRDSDWTRRTWSRSPKGRESSKGLNDPNRAFPSAFPADQRSKASQIRRVDRFFTVALNRLAAAGDPRLRALLQYARGRRDPFTAAEAAIALGIHRNMARSRLDRLTQAGFLAVAFERRGGRVGPGAGRPAKVYRVAPELEGVEFPDRRLADLIGLLVGKLPARSREKALREAGEEFGRSLAEAAGLKASANVQAGLERVCAALASLGFQASLQA